jgi:hypothetical protein
VPLPAQSVSSVEQEAPGVLPLPAVSSVLIPLPSSALIHMQQEMPQPSAESVAREVMPEPADQVEPVQPEYPVPLSSAVWVAPVVPFSPEASSVTTAFSASPSPSPTTPALSPRPEVREESAVRVERVAPAEVQPEQSVEQEAPVVRGVTAVKLMEVVSPDLTPVSLQVLTISLQLSQ